jgi:hypothetical protein
MVVSLLLVETLIKSHFKGSLMKHIAASHILNSQEIHRYTTLALFGWLDLYLKAVGGIPNRQTPEDIGTGLCRYYLSLVNPSKCF